MTVCVCISDYGSLWHFIRCVCVSVCHCESVIFVYISCVFMCNSRLNHQEPIRENRTHTTT